MRYRDYDFFIVSLVIAAAIIVYFFSFKDISYDKSSLLADNLLVLIVATLIAYEMGVSKLMIMATFLISSVLVILATTALYPLIMLLGVSVGVYAIIGLAAIKSYKIVPLYVFIPVFAAATFLKFIVYSFDIYDPELLLQSLLQFGGIVVGIVAFTLFRKIYKKQKIKILSSVSKG